MATQELGIINESNDEKFSVTLSETGDLLVSVPEGREVWLYDELPERSTGRSVRLSPPENLATAEAGSTGLSNRDRTRMRKMFEKNVASQIIAEKFNIPTRSVAAYRANWTRSL